MDGLRPQWMNGLRLRGNTFLRFFGYKHFHYLILCGLLGVVSACLLGTGFWLMYLAIDSFLGSSPLNDTSAKSSISLLVSLSAPYLLVLSLLALVLGEAFFFGVSNCRRIFRSVLRARITAIPIESISKIRMVC